MWCVRLQVTCSLVSMFHRNTQTDCMGHVDWQRIYWTVCFTALSSSGVFCACLWLCMLRNNHCHTRFFLCTNLTEYILQEKKRKEENWQHISTQNTCTNCTGVLEVYTSLFIFFMCGRYEGDRKRGDTSSFQSCLINISLLFYVFSHDSDCDCWGHRFVLCECVIIYANNSLNRLGKK